MPDESIVNSQPVNQPPSETPASWDDALKGFSPDVQALYASHVSGLKNTVQATREERDALAKQIREVSAKAEKGSELEKSLTELGTRLEAAERKAAFVEDAVRPEIGCRNPKAAYALATAENLFDRKGNPDWAAIKAQAPELFGAAPVNGNAGAGTQSPPPKNSMNDFIRRSAGRS